MVEMEKELPELMQELSAVEERRPAQIMEAKRLVEKDLCMMEQGERAFRHHKR